MPLYRVDHEAVRRVGLAVGQVPARLSGVASSLSSLRGAAGVVGDGPAAGSYGELLHWWCCVLEGEAGLVGQLASSLGRGAGDYSAAEETVVRFEG